MNHCDQCGADADCRTLFDQLLALEFSQQEPWGPLHGVTVPVAVGTPPRRELPPRSGAPPPSGKL